MQSCISQGKELSDKKLKKKQKDTKCWQKRGETFSYTLHM